jgi:hypothetical protein
VGSWRFRNTSFLLAFGSGFPVSPNYSEASFFWWESKRWGVVGDFLFANVESSGQQHRNDLLPLVSQAARFCSLRFPREQPLERFPKLPTDPQQDLGPDLLFPALYRRKIALTDTYQLGEFLLGHIKSSELTNPPTHRFPLD